MELKKMLLIVYLFIFSEHYFSRFLVYKKGKSCIYIMLLQPSKI